jgi:phosphoribosylformimino-5-aminoimidazole carboxamide ribotide isomerase
MLIPSIDLQSGRIVQLVQGERLAVETTRIDEWVQRFKGRPKVQLIDLDAAKGEGSNDQLVERICGELPCRVGGGIRSLARAQRVLGGGATHVIIGSALFIDGAVDLIFAGDLAAAVGQDRLIAAVDSRGGRVVIDGWRTPLTITPVDAVRQLEPFVDEFLYTNVDREGLLKGTDMTAIAAVRNATSRRLTAAGGITTAEEVAALDALGVDAVVGMAIYTGRMDWETLR